VVKRIASNSGMRSRGAQLGDDDIHLSRSRVPALIPIERQDLGWGVGLQIPHVEVRSAALQQDDDRLPGLG